MKQISKIMCFCGCGLGSSFMLEMTIKKALEELNINDVEVEHSNLDDAVSGAADIFICASDLLPNAKDPANTIGIDNLVDVEEYKEKLTKFLDM